MPEWVWLGTYKRYRDLETGRWTSAEKVREWSEQATDASVDVISDLADMLTEDRLNVNDWTLLMRDEIKDLYVQEYVLGKGGLDQMDQRDWGSIGGMLKEQYRYLDRFTKEIADGDVTPGRIAPRAAMYGNSAREAFFRAHARALGMPPLPDYPGSGNTICLTNCKCAWDIREIRDAEGNIVRWDCHWLLRPAEHCTSKQSDSQGRPRGCIERAALWGPLVLRPTAEKGGPDSGYHRPHFGRPGKIGGSERRAVHLVPAPEGPQQPPLPLKLERLAEHLKPGVSPEEEQARNPFRFAVENQLVLKWKDLGGGISDTKLVSYEGDGQGVWKLNEGVDVTFRGDWGEDLEKGSNAVAAYEIAELLSGPAEYGKELTPEVVWGELDGEWGTVQHFIAEADTLSNTSDNTLVEVFAQAENIRRAEIMVALDKITDNRDRHRNNALISHGGLLYAIDHDLVTFQVTDVTSGVGRNAVVGRVLGLGLGGDTFKSGRYGYKVWRMSKDLRERWQKIDHIDLERAMPDHPEWAVDNAWSNLQAILEHGGAG